MLIILMYKLIFICQQRGYLHSTKGIRKGCKVALDCSKGLRVDDILDRVNGDRFVKVVIDPITRISEVGHVVYITVDTCFRISA